MDWGWMLPEPVSTFGGEIDSLYYLILVITGAIFVIVEVALVVFVIRYRRREGRKAAYSHGNKVAEMVWTVVPFVLVLYIAYQSNDVWLRTKVAERGLENESALPLRVVGKQFEWNVTYPGPDEELDTDDDYVVRNQLHMPVGRSVRIELMSEDVIHSFFLPEFRVKQDAVPGMLIPVWFQATEAGEYTLACAELCGLGHYRMRASVTVHEPEEFERWVAEESSAGEPPEPVPAPADTARVDLEAAHDGGHDDRQAREGDDQA
ncbi:MAG TPA: cytochrome c oxidase subunit II [Gemmatimonadota bacterium]|nr:cytochrome c oxidase subunit II [Gemmatimonadota bacterium]